MPRISIFSVLFLIGSLCCFTTFATAQGSGGKGGGGKGSSGGQSGSSGTLELGGAGPSFLTGVSAPHAEDERKVEFKSTTVLVQVPAVVVDKSGNHIHGLTKDDFQVLENGKEQKLTVFEENVAGKSASPAKALAANEFSNTSGSESTPRSAAVILLDTVNTPLLDQTYGRRELLKYLSQNLDPERPLALAVITSNGLKVVQGLTTDSARLIEALKKVSSEAPAMTGTTTDAQAAAVSGDISRFDPVSLLNGGDAMSALQDFVSAGDAAAANFQQERAVETTLQAFLGVAWSLSGVPGRKSVIWATGGFPFYLDSASTVPGGYLTTLYERAMTTLNDAQISIYPVDVRGLVNFLPVADLASGHVAHGLRPDFDMRHMSNRSWLQYSTTDTLRDFAVMTGGKALYNSNDLVGGFKRAIDDSSSYYLLGYYLDTSNTKPGWRQLKVKLQQKDKAKDAEIRARTGFFVTNASVNPDLSRKTDLDFAAISPFESTGLPMTVRWLGSVSDADKKKVQFGLQLPPNSLILGINNLLSFDYLVLAYANKDGTTAQRLGKTIQGNIAAERVAQLQAQGIGFKNELELPPGEYTVRFVVRDDVSGRVGSVSAPLSVN